MLRFRRYRVFVACAVFVIFLLYRVSRNAGWEDDFESQFQYVAAVLPNPGHKSASAELPQNPVIPHQSAGGEGNKADDKVSIPELKTESTAEAKHAYDPPAAANGDRPADGHKKPAAEKLPGSTRPELQPGKVHDVYPDVAQNPLPIQNPPGSFEPTTTYTPPIHWTKLPEHFPVPEGALISLPTGKPVTVPTIQYSFQSETSEAKAKREERRDQVKKEAKIAWDAYRKYAFGHDELMPLTNGSRDPFCGWAATLVDSLDTLWIMGLKKEFDEAYEFLNNIDFTTTQRNEIPVFETTIRYLGGLLAAYDVTGGHKGDYPLLLKKAVELAEILMGVFDTPNRMPILYYNWKPAFASQPKRASTRSGVAEFGTLSMEFTRLAQLTGKDRYYDAVARITDALDEWQNRDDDTSSLIPGIFPQDIDASGCNRTATLEATLDTVSTGAQQQAVSHTPQEPVGYKPKTAGSVELRESGSSGNLAKRDAETRTPPMIGAPHRGSSTGVAVSKQPLTDSGLPVGRECVAQNLTASTGFQSYGMGGSQDSAYEYFPKQYLLLGGLEAKYRSLHEKTVEAVKKYLLFKPMTKNNADILFSSRAKVQPGYNGADPTMTRDYEVTHLTCFLGGMFAMGGKIFDSAEDLDVGRRLTDGCVWAYSSMPSGIMAEFAKVTPCQSDEACPWNETAWYLGIDPDSSMRETQMRVYEDRMLDWKVDKQKALRDEAVRQQAEEELGIQTRPADLPNSNSIDAKAGVPKSYGGLSRSRGGDWSRKDDAASAHSKRDLDIVSEDTPAYDPATLNQQAIEEKVKKLDALYYGEPAELKPMDPPAGSFGGVAGHVTVEESSALPPKRIKPPFKVPNMPHKPMTHEEVVLDRIKTGSLPPGYTQIGSPNFQLRPEAIESVWYMYRITGDTTWQDKGWKMWQSIVDHVRVQSVTTGDPAHSAIAGVHDLSLLKPTDNMESFWLAETLKYFYLLYSEPDVISLDDWVLNTEAHPFRRPS